MKPWWLREDEDCSTPKITDKFFLSGRGDGRSYMKPWWLGEDSISCTPKIAEESMKGRESRVVVTSSKDFKRQEHYDN